MRELIHSFLKWFPTAAAGGAVGVSAVWEGARDWIGSYVAWLWQAMSDPWTALALLAALAAYIAAIVWTGRKPDSASEPVVVHRIEPDPVGDMFRRAANRPQMPSPQQCFDGAILTLRHVVNAREMWWSENHRRSGPSPLGNRLLDAIDAIRQCFPPEAVGRIEDDQVSRLHRVAASYGRVLGYDTKDTDRLKTARSAFDKELDATVELFKQISDRPEGDGQALAGPDRARKQAIIATGRDLAHLYRTEKPSDTFETFARRQREFFDIQPHLGLEYQQCVSRNARTVHATNDGSSVPEAMFLRELARLEKEWGLV